MRRFVILVVFVAVAAVVFASVAAAAHLGHPVPAIRPPA
jgi:DMSO reductase anchor subunit